VAGGQLRTDQISPEGPTEPSKRRKTAVMPLPATSANPLETALVMRSLRLYFPQLVLIFGADMANVLGSGLHFQPNAVALGAQALAAVGKLEIAVDATAAV